jgi:hypothetical protein
MFVKGVTYDRLFYLGATPMFLAFFIVALLTHWDNWDPIRDALTACWRRCRCCRRRPVTSSSGVNDNESTTITTPPTRDSNGRSRHSYGNDDDEENAALMESEVSPAVETATAADA